MPPHWTLRRAEPAPARQVANRLVAGKMGGVPTAVHFAPDYKPELSINADAVNNSISMPSQSIG